VEILNCLNKFTFIKELKILKLRYFEDGFYIKILAILKDNSQLYITEYNDIEVREYSYHWQTSQKEMIVRWDNAPHHKTIKTFPHHKHLENKVVESYEIDCYSILNEILKYLENKS